MEEDLDTIIEYYQNWKIKINTDKTQAVYYQRLKRRKSRENLRIGKQIINWSKEAKYLGVTLDENLTYSSHIKNIKNK